MRKLVPTSFIRFSYYTYLIFPSAYSIILFMTKEEIASYIDHTILSPEIGVKQISKLCNGGLELGEFVR